MEWVLQWVRSPREGIDCKIYMAERHVQNRKPWKWKFWGLVDQLIVNNFPLILSCIETLNGRKGSIALQNLFFLNNKWNHQHVEAYVFSGTNLGESQFWLRSFYQQHKSSQPFPNDDSTRTGGRVWVPWLKWTFSFDFSPPEMHVIGCTSALLKSV